MSCESSDSAWVVPTESLWIYVVCSLQHSLYYTNVNAGKCFHILLLDGHNSHLFNQIYFFNGIFCQFDWCPITQVNKGAFKTLSLRRLPPFEPTQPSPDEQRCQTARCIEAGRGAADHKHQSSKHLFGLRDPTGQGYSGTAGMGGKGGKSLAKERYSFYRNEDQEDPFWDWAMSQNMIGCFGLGCWNDGSTFVVFSTGFLGAFERWNHLQEAILRCLTCGFIRWRGSWHQDKTSMWFCPSCPRPRAAELFCFHLKWKILDEFVGFVILWRAYCLMCLALIFPEGFGDL